MMKSMPSDKPSTDLSKAFDLLRQQLRGSVETVEMEIAGADRPANVERAIQITSTQNALLKFQEHPNATTHARAAFTIGKQLRIRPQMDIDRLRRALDAVTTRHEVMRTRFYCKPSGFGAYIEKIAANALTVETVQTESEALQRAGELAQEFIAISDPMFRVTIIRAGTASDFLVVKGHHLVLDGYSMGLILEDMVKAYLGLPLSPAEMTIEQYIQDFDHVGKPGSFARREAFLREVFAEPLPPIPNLGRKAKGERPNVDIVDCTVGGEVMLTVPHDRHEGLRQRARAAGTTEAALVMAAFARTIGARGKVDDLILQVPCALRHDRRLENYVNFVASDVPVRVQLSRFGSLEALAVALGEGVNKALEFAPFMDTNYGGALHDEVVSRGSYTSLFVVGSRTVDKWMRTTASAPLQRPGQGERDLGFAKVTILPDMRLQVPRIAELDLRSFPAEGGLGLAMAYDGLGYDDPEAEEILREVASRLLQASQLIEESPEGHVVEAAPDRQRRAG